MKTIAIILAAGKGVRMKSDLPKVSHMICGKPLVVMVLEAIQKLPLDRVFVVVGYKADVVKEECKDFNVTFVEQKEQLGTGHAVMQAKPFVNGNPVVLVLSGDVPLIRAETLQQLIDFHKSKGASATVLTASVDDPHLYGRIIRSSTGEVLKIVEAKDAKPEELSVKEINSGTFCFDCREMFAALDKVRPNNAQKEYYLTDIIEILRGRKLPVHAYKAEESAEVLGVNTLAELKKMEENYKRCFT